MKALVKPIVASLIAGLPFLASPVLASSKTKTSEEISSPEKSFTVSVNQITNSEVIRVLVYKPESKRLSIKLKDASGSTIHSFLTEKNANRVGEDYDFLDAEDGTYTLEVSDGKSTVSKQIKLQHAKVERVASISIK